MVIPSAFSPTRCGVGLWEWKNSEKNDIHPLVFKFSSYSIIRTLHPGTTHWDCNVPLPTRTKANSLWNMVAQLGYVFDATISIVGALDLFCLGRAWDIFSHVIFDLSFRFARAIWRLWCDVSEFYDVRHSNYIVLFLFKIQIPIQLGNNKKAQGAKAQIEGGGNKRFFLKK